MKKVWIAAIATAMAATGLVIWAQGPFHNPKVVQALGLTPEQQQKLEDMRYQYRKETVNLKRDMELSRLDLEKEMDKENPDVKVVDRLLDQQGALRNQMSKARVHHLLDAKKVLTPEQWAKARQHMQAMRAKNRSQRRGGDGFDGMGRRGRGLSGGGPGGPPSRPGSGPQGGTPEVPEGSPDIGG